VSFDAITLCVGSQRAVPKVSVYFVMIQSGNVSIHPRSTVQGNNSKRLWWVSHVETEAA